MATLADILFEKRDEHKRGITFIEAGDKDLFISYGQLYKYGLKALYILQQRGIQPGEELVLQLENQRSFITIFWACILGGIIPVPLSATQKDDHRQKLFNIWPVLKHPNIIADAEHLQKIKAFAQDNNCIDRFTTMYERFIDVAQIEKNGNDGICHTSNEDDIAFIQFSSGSTGAPKGVMLTHKNILTNVKDISEAAAYTLNDTLLSWMPLTHDMGLIGFHLNPLVAGIHQFLMPTDLFVRRPALWLDKASQHKVSVLCSPNFGYRYFLRHCTAMEPGRWNLSAVRIIYNGAEPISVALCKEFSRSLETFGLKKNVIRPVYGLAEASLAVSMSALDEEIISVELNGAQMNVGASVTAPAAGAYTMEVVNVGKPITHCAVRITGRNGKILGENQLGLIQIKGPNVTGGYYQNAKATKEVLKPGKWLNTGDIGFLRNGNLFVAGRDKDILFSNGQNYYPHDIERLAEAGAGIELNKIIVAGYFNSSIQKDEAIAFVFHRGTINSFIPVCKKLKQIIGQKTGLELDKVLPVTDIPRTTSGKLQRFRMLQLYRAGRFDAVVKELEYLLKQSLESGTLAGERNDVTEKIIEIWKHVLNRAVVQGNESFFELGGNSLRATELSMLIAKEFQVEVPFEILYEHQTVNSLAKIINQGNRAEYIPIPAAGNQHWYPLAYNQRRIFYAAQLNNRSVAYNTPIAFVVKGKIMANRLELVIKELIRRHDSLRIAFDDTGDARFEVPENVPFSLESIAVQVEQCDIALKNLVQPFHLSCAPLFRITLLHVEDGETVLFADFHHIIADGISVSQFFAELITLYRGGQLPQLPVTYKDYALWDKAEQQEQKYNLNEAYWQQVFATDWPALEMPADYRRPAVFDTAGEKLRFEFTTEEAVQLRKLAQHNNCTLHAVMLTIYKLLLFKYTGQQQMVVGIPVSGRIHPDIQEVQGMFVNNLAICSNIQEHDTFKTFLEETKRIIMEAFRHQDYPFDKLVQLVAGKRDSSRNPIFDTMFMFRHPETHEYKTADFTLEEYFFNPGFARFDISMEVVDDGSDLCFYLEYATGLFRKETIVNFARHYTTIAGNIVLQPNARLAQLEILSAAEYQQNVYTLNNTFKELPSVGRVDRLFEQQALGKPENIAIDYEGEQISYRQLNKQADRIADALRSAGVKKDTVVSVLLPRCPMLIAGLLGIMKAGAVFLMIEPELPAERIKYLIRNSQSAVVISTAVFEKAIQQSGAAVIFIDAENNISSNQRIVPQPEDSSPCDPAYLIYTSGTTGNPKGALIPHEALTNYISWAACQYVKGEKGDFPLFTSLAFDLTITSIFVPLITGNTIVIYKEWDREVLIEKIVRDNKVDIIKLTPSHLRLLRETISPDSVSSSNIKRFIVGGEILETKLAAEISDIFGGRVEVYNEYGPAEATVGCMIHKYNKQEPYANVPVGVPADNTQIYILDKYLMPVPTGVIGELYIAGAGLAKEYVYNPEMTAAKFIDNPFLPGHKMYKTGDLAKRYGNGLIDCIGRADMQVKVNGHRVELMEIESCLLAHPGIGDAAVVLKESAVGYRSLHAFYKLSSGNDEAPEPVEIKNYLAEKLPYYMIPARLSRIEEIPLTKNGKVDYKTLAGIQDDAPVTTTTAAGNDIERRSLSIWTEVLGRADITITDHFFELGGDSIKAVQIAAKLYQEGTLVSVKDLLTYQTIQQISRYAKPVKGENGNYNQGPAEGHKVLSAIDNWFFAQRFNNPHWYNQSLLLKWNKRVNKAHIEKALEMMVAHHDGLRLNYDTRENKLFFNERHPGKTNLLTEKHLTAATTANATAISHQPELVLLGSSFDIENTLLFKACLLHTHSDNFLVLIAHHLVVDGLSWRVLLEDLFTICTALEKGETPRLPLKTVPLNQWQHEMAAITAKGKWQKEKSYWAAVESTAFTLPVDFENCQWLTKDMGRITGTLDNKYTEALVKGAFNVFNTDVQALLATALIMALKEWTGLDEYLVEWESHGRQLESLDASRTVGWFTALYPVQLHYFDTGVSNLIKATKETLRKVPGGGMGYGTLKYSNGPLPVNNARHTIPEIRFNYLGRFDREFNNELFDVAVIDNRFNISPENNMTVKIECNVFIISGRLHVEVYYNTTAHRYSTIQKFVTSFTDHLQFIAKYINKEEDIHFTPSDFGGLKIGQDELDSLFE